MVSTRSVRGAGVMMMVSTRRSSNVVPVGVSSSIAPFPAAIIQAEIPMTAAHRKRTM